jgi:LytS/YehU family sensor histidine kinase
MSIYYLCDSDAKKAQQATLDFSSYLRQSFNELSAKGLVPFTDELEHAKAYLGVEMARVEDKLSCEFDTPVTNFRIPPLTLQPILEMAVLHGVDPENSPLHIEVNTVELPDEYQIIIKDDGPRYKPADEKNPLLALDPIRKRLKKMANASLDIEPREGMGTIVTIHIPKSS